MRAVGVASQYATFNAILILLVQVTPLALDAISWRYFMIFLIMDVIFIIVFYFMYPETKGKTLEEIEGVFGDRLAETIEEAGKNVELEQTDDLENGTKKDARIGDKEHIEVGRD